MSDTVKVVIEIPKKIYEHACDGVIKFVTLEMDVEIEKAIRYIQNVLIQIAIMSYQNITAMGIILSNISLIFVLFVDRLFCGKVRRNKYDSGTID